MSISTIAARVGGVSLAAVLLLGPGVAWADSPHFIKATGTIDPTTFDYTATWKEAGLGSTPVTYELVATKSSSTWQCFTKSNNKPQGSPQAGGAGEIVSTVTFTPHNGSITGSASLTPEVGTASCQGGGLKLCLTAVSYDGVSITDTTTQPNVTEPLPSFTNVTVPPPSRSSSGTCQ